MKEYSKWIVCVALYASWAMLLHAQRSYTLEECRTMALKNNVKVRNAANDVYEARLGRKEALTAYFPDVTATGMGYNANRGLVRMEMGPGMSVSLLKNGVMGGVTLTQPVFAGGRIVNGNRLAAINVEVSGIRKERNEDEVRLTVERYYWQVVALQEKLNTLHAVERQLDGICKDVETAVNAGVTNRNDLLQVRLRRNDIACSRVSLENSLSVCRMMLAQYIGLGADTVAIDGYVPADTVPEFPRNLYRRPENMLAMTDDYRLLESDVRANRIQQRMEQGKNMPSVAVGAGYMYDNLMGKSHSFAAGFVSVSVPLSGWWGGSYAVRRRKLQVRNAENRLADSSELLLIAMNKAWADLQDAYKQMLIAHSSIEQSTENMRLNDDYYHAGTTTMSDLLDAQSMVQQSRDKYVEAYTQFRIRTVEYLQATGRLTP